MIGLTGRDQVLAALGADHAFGRFTTGMATGVQGLAWDDAVLWWGETPLGRIGHALGPVPPAEIARLVRDEVGWVNVVRPPASSDGWDFRWTTAIPPTQPGQERVVPVDDDAAVNGLLDLALPDSVVRPGHPMALGWYGIWAGDRLIACAADRSGELAGVIGGVAVHPDCEGRGLGAAVSAHLTAKLVASRGLACLGVMSGNDRAPRLYERLGYRSVLYLRSVDRDDVAVLVGDHDPQGQIDEDLRTGQQAGHNEDQPHQGGRHAEPAGQA